MVLIIILFFKDMCVIYKDVYLYLVMRRVTGWV